MKMREFLYFIYILNFWIYICEYIFIYKNVWFYLIYKWSYQFLNADKGLGSFFDWWKCSVTCRDSDCQSASARSMANTVKDTNDSVPPPPHFFYARAKSIGRGRHSECPTFRWTSDCRHGASSSSESSWTPGDMQPAWPLFRRICYRVSCKALRWNPIMYDMSPWHELPRGQVVLEPIPLIGRSVPQSCPIITILLGSGPHSWKTWIWCSPKLFK